ncbi:bacteriocin immunity protein [Lactiplantibacillus garii]|uniref:Bacteriocin immunity protein n=1 Tax=Lactiplantibacillus garii TaxID=2306423 RepID=A0A3R8KIK3_9LACO|nr:bacteriocin immunity protein [Lactiplantibacillus garii]RRK10555.1 bacteriocin immunity protein [Lactiplantibacillus garii]
MNCEVRGIIRSLITDLASTEARGYPEIRRALLLAEHQLADQAQAGPLISHLANYITYTVFSNRLHLTATQNLLVGQLLALGRRSAGAETVTDPSDFR